MNFSHFAAFCLLLTLVAGCVSSGETLVSFGEAMAAVTIAQHSTPVLPTAAAAEAVDGDNILNILDAGNVSDAYLNQNFQGAEMSLGGWTIFNYAAVTTGIYYASNYDLTHSVWYDHNRVFLAAFGNGVAPPGAAFVRVSIQSGATPTTMLIRGGVVPSTFRAYFAAGLPTPTNPPTPTPTSQPTPTPTPTSQPTPTSTPTPNGIPYAGGKAVFLGTSLTFQGVYVSYVKSRTGLGTVVNRGVSGQLLRTVADNLTSSDVAGASFVSIEGSTNDYGHGYSIAGTTADADSVASICGDLRYVVNKIRALSPTVKIFVMNDTWRGKFYNEPVPPAANPYGLTLESASNAMMQEAAFLHIPHWDNYQLSGITQVNFSNYTQDNLHWNDAGGALVGNGYGDYINAH